MATIKSLSKQIKQQNIKQIDLRFTSFTGQLHHMILCPSEIDERFATDGIYFDGSSLEGWQPINMSDMALKPDLSTIKPDPFAVQPTLMIFCDVIDPRTKKPYEKDPRSIARHAVSYMTKKKVADNVFMGPELEFFVFDDVKISTDPHAMSFHLDSTELATNQGRSYDAGNLAHRTGAKGGYTPAQPLDSLSDLRGEMVDILNEIGVTMEKHHHEVAPAQCELGMRFGTLVECADNTQLYKYVVKNTARLFGKTATFIPKPFFNDNGSGMHVHQSLFSKGKNVFSGKGYAGLSDKALWYVGGILKHAKALNAFTNPTTNSYKRLVPGFEAPVVLAYASHNRSVACRIPHVPSDKARRVEIRFPDPAANPYLAFAAMLMAGLDGIKNKIDPGKAQEDNMYELTDAKLKKTPTVAASLEEALNALEKDHDFLNKGDVFTQSMIADYITLKREEVDRLRTTPHPVEMEMYYSV